MRKFIWWSLLFIAIGSVNNFLLVDYFSKEHAKLESEVGNLYFISVMQSHQIRYLQNLELRRQNKDIQQRLTLVRDASEE